MVTIKASYNVLPDESTPKGRFWLSDIDQMARPRHTLTIYIYKTKENNHDVIERLRKSLSKVLVYYYPLAGQLLRIESCSRWELECNNTKGVTLLEAETRKTLHDYGDFSPSDSTKELVPYVDYGSKPAEEFPLLLVQVTRFHCNEGIAIGVALSHFLADGVAGIHFINSWAKIARGGGEALLDSTEMPFLDRTVLKFSHHANSPSSPPRFDHHEFKALPLKLGASSSMDERNKKTCAELLKLSAEQVEKLKRMANSDVVPNEQGSRPCYYSRFEAIAAHIWRCASKARELDDNQPTLFRFNADIRNRIIPPLPKNYFGNALALMATPTCLVGEMTSKPLSYTTSKVRKGTAMLTNEFIRSQIDIIRAHEENLDKARAIFFGQNEGEKALFYGNPNLQITSWMTMPLYEADFGWGKPLYVGIPIVFPQDRAYILLSPDGDGSVLVLMHFQIAHIQLFKKFFYEDILLDPDLV